MKKILQIYLSKKKLKDLDRETLEDKFLEQQEELKKAFEEIKKLKKQFEKEKKQKVNTETNKPSSKKPEWDKDGNPEKKGKKPKKNGGRRKGSGNQKKEVAPDKEHTNPLKFCPECEISLTDNSVIKQSSRIIEDIIDPPESTIVYKENQETKWCPECQAQVKSKSSRALPGSDFGLNTLVLCAYFWVITSISLPNIQKFLSNFLKLSLSTSGISKMMIRLSAILDPVYKELQDEVKTGANLWADETGWRIRGKLHWLWAFATDRTAYYWVDKSRGNIVVEKVLGSIFYGLLITDAWGAYSKLQSKKQTCMSHIFRKIRGFIEHYPEYRSILKFYIKLKKIIKDAEKLQANRCDLEEMVFHRRLKLLKARLSKLLAWRSPNPILKSVIKKVKRQETYILTFVEHEGASSHNNYAEYIIKKGVLKRKISGGSMSLRGAKAFAVIQSIAQTCHLRELSFQGFLKASLIQFVQKGRPMLLSEYELAVKVRKAKAA